jgi:hypothetical protein
MNPGDLTTLANARAWLGLSGIAIAGITNANPAVVTLAAAPPTPLSSGLTVGISAINGMTQLNGTEQVITVISPTTFSIPVDSTLFGTYTSGGLASVSDTLMQRLITAISAYFSTVCDRTFRNQSYNETRDGTGGASLLLRNFPITSVSALMIDGVPVPARPALNAASQITSAGFLGYFGGPSGYAFDDKRLLLAGGYLFARGPQNVNIAYAGGYLVSNEAQTIPASAPYVLTTLAQWNAGDRGVTYANGTALTAQPFGSALATGQYSVDANGVYYFAAADAGKPVLISYGYIPYDLEQGAIDCIGDWFKYRSRIGVISMSIEQQTVTYVNTALPKRAADIVAKYSRVAWLTP